MNDIRTGVKQLLSEKLAKQMQNFSGHCQSSVKWVR